jgi:hypothetical protein
VAISYVGGRTFSFEGTTTDQTISLTTLTGGSDTAPSAGDFVVVYYGTGSNSTARTISVGSSYTNLTKLLGSDTYDTHLVVGYKFMGGTPDTNVTVSGTGNIADAGAGVIHVFRGVDETTPLDVTAVPANASNSVLCNPAAITPTTAGAWVVAGGAGAHIAGAETYSSSNLTSFRSQGESDTYDVTVGAGLFTTWTSGAFDPAAFTFSDGNATSYSWAAYTIALRPSPNELVIPTGVSASATVNGARVAGGIDYIGGRAAAFLGTTSTTNLNLTNLTGGINNAPWADDIVVIFYGIGRADESTNTISVSGYTSLGLSRPEDTYATSLDVSYKIMGSTPDTSATLSSTISVENAAAVAVHVFSGVNTATPMDVTSTVATNSSSAIPNPPAITPVTVGAVVVAGGAAGHNDGTDTFSSSDLTSFRTSGANDTYDVSIGAGYVRWVSGAVNPAAFTWTGTDNNDYSSAARTLALRPAITPDITVEVTGVSSTGAVGTVEVVILNPDVDVPVTGVSASGAVGTTTVVGTAVFPVTGVSATGQAGTATAVISVSATVTGVSATGAVSSAGVTGTATVSVTGVSATGEVGSVDVATLVIVDGVGATGQVGAVSVTGSAAIDATGVSATGAVGTVVVIPTTNVSVTGLSASGTVGSVTVLISQLVSVTGVAAFGRVSGVLVWGPVLPNQDPNYGPVDPTQVPGWSAVSPSQTPGYAAVAPNQNPGYSSATPDQTPGWTPIAS